MFRRPRWRSSARAPPVRRPRRPSWGSGRSVSVLDRISAGCRSWRPAGRRRSHLTMVAHPSNVTEAMPLCRRGRRRDVRPRRPVPDPGAPRTGETDEAALDRHRPELSTRAAASRPAGRPRSIRRPSSQRASSITACRTCPGGRAHGDACLQQRGLALPVNVARYGVEPCARGGPGPPRGAGLHDGHAGNPLATLHDGKPDPRRTGSISIVKSSHARPSARQRVESGFRVFLTGQLLDAPEPPRRVRCARSVGLRDVEVCHVLTIGTADYCRPRWPATSG